MKRLFAILLAILAVTFSVFASAASGDNDLPPGTFTKDSGSGLPQAYSSDLSTSNTLTGKTQDGSSTPATPFIDVKSGDYFAKAVAWAVSKGVTQGQDSTHFAPTAPCTRGQMVTFLWRAAGSPEPKDGSSRFADVRSSDYFAQAVAWAVENNITNGTAKNTFAPNALVDRAQAVTFLWRAQGSPAAPANAPFADVVSGSYYESAVLWAVANNITNGTAKNTFTFAPNALVDRAQAVTFLYRANIGA